MGAFRLRGGAPSTRGKGAEVCIAGALEHEGPLTRVRLDAGGGGWLSWLEGRGRGQITLEGRPVEVELTYLSSGHYVYQALSKGRVISEGRIREDQRVGEAPGNGLPGPASQASVF